MSPTQIANESEVKFKKALNHFIEEIKKLRTGRAHPSMVENVVAEAYGTPMPLVQLATITTPEPQLIQISPFDVNNLKTITEAIRNNQSLGLNPTDDGRVIRITIPPLTTERRQQIAKQLGEKLEEALISTRQARHEARGKLDKLKKDQQLSEDEVARIEKQIDSNMNEVKQELETASKNKEQEILKV